MSYIHYINNEKYAIETITYNYYRVLKNGQLVEVCDTYEEAQDYIDNIVN